MVMFDQVAQGLGNGDAVETYDQQLTDLFRQ